MIAAGESIWRLNGSDVKAETRMYLQQLAKRGVRAPNMPAGVKRLESNGASAAECHIGENMSGTLGRWACAHPTSASSGARLSSKGSKSSERLGGHDPRTACEKVSMQCVGVALGGTVGINDNAANGEADAAGERPGHGFHAADATLDRALPLRGFGPGMHAQAGKLPESFMQVPNTMVPSRRKKAVFRP